MVKIFNKTLIRATHACRVVPQRVGFDWPRETAGRRTMSAVVRPQFVPHRPGRRFHVPHAAEDQRPRHSSLSVRPERPLSDSAALTRCARARETRPRRAVGPSLVDVTTLRRVKLPRITSFFALDSPRGRECARVAFAWRSRSAI
jgi:hypothetical protein